MIVRYRDILQDFSACGLSIEQKMTLYTSFTTAVEESMETADRVARYDTRLT